MRTAFTAALLLSFVSASCGRTHEAALQPREEFHWSRQPISFAPPPENWRREGELSGGVKGIRFVKEGSVGEAITIGEMYAVGERDRTEAIQDLLDHFDGLDRRQFLRQASLARARIDTPYSQQESSVAEGVNAAIDRSTSDYLNGDQAGARTELENALAEAQKLQFSLADLVATPSRSWTSERNGHVYVNREMYFLRRNHLFTARFIGLNESLPLFERVVATIELPQ